MREPFRPNILYIHSHDTGRYIEPYGNASATPQLASLAEGGVLFRNAFSAAPTCSPSRAALLTGQAPHSCGMLGLAHRGFALYDYRHHLVGTLRSHGYLTALAGVQHVAHGSPSDIPFGGGPEPGGEDGGLPAWKIIGYDRYLGGYETAHEEAVRFISAPPPGPFFLSVGFFETHREFPELEDPREADQVAPPAPLPDLPAIRTDRARYERSVRELDRKIGLVLEALDRSGRAENTLVIATTDHGIAFPRMKSHLTDDGVGVYLIMRGPRDFEGGRVVDALVSQIDLFPTLCDYLEIERPEWLQGRSLLPILRGERPEVNDRIFAEVSYHAAYEPQRCVRTPRYKYIARYDGRTTPVLPNIDDGESKNALLESGWFPVEAEALYDLLFDPHETNNLAGEAQYAQRLSELRGTLLEWMRSTADPLLAGLDRDGRPPGPGEHPARIPAPEGARINKPDGRSATEPTIPA